MKKLVAVTIISVILLAAVITNATAESEKQDFNLENANKETETTSTTTLNVRTLNNRNDNKTITQIKVQRIGKDHPKWKGFEMKGNISNLSSFSFDINGISIIMDATITGKLQIKGTLADGSFVKVEGKVINEKYYAKEIKISITPTPSSTPTGTVQKTGDQYKISVAGNLLDIIKVLEDLLSKLKLQV